ncbi:hypothetical protein D3C77_448360 [compost metagenome]
MNPDMEIFLGGVLSGAKATRKRHLMQAAAIQRAINDRWGLSAPEQWKAKHVRWFLHEHQKHLAPNTRYWYWLTVEILLVRLKKVNDWEPHLRGPWRKPS